MADFKLLPTVNGLSVSTTDHTHDVVDIAGLEANLNNKLEANSAAISANKLTTSRTIDLTGDVSGSVSFDGTKDVSIEVTVNNDSHQHNFSTVNGLQTVLDNKANINHGHSLNELTNVVISDNSLGEILKWNGTAWVNNTLAEAGIQPAGSYLTANQSITVSGDVSGSGTTNINLILTNTGVTAGTYTKVTVDAKGRATLGGNIAVTDVPALDASKITSGTFNAARLPSASTGTAGIVQLSSATNSTSTTLAATASAVKAAYDLADAAIPSNQKGTANGVATLDANGLVSANQLPSYVDDVLEYNSLLALPAVGESGKIYVTIDNNKIYRWSGSGYIEISPSAGSVDSAVRLTTARVLTIGNSGKLFDGSANVSWSLAEIGAAAIIHTHTSSQITDATSNNSVNTIVKRDASGNFSAGTITASLAGNASTANKLQTARTINGVSFDGSADVVTNVWGNSRIITVGATGKTVNGATNVSWTLAEIGAAASLHVHTSESITDATNANTANTLVKRDASGNFSAGTITASLAGNAVSANMLQTARTINGTSFNGSVNIVTTSWGTNRSITIGNSSKSVNGSSDVSWTLEEIGATNASNLNTGTIADARLPSRLSEIELSTLIDNKIDAKLAELDYIEPFLFIGADCAATV